MERIIKRVDPSLPVQPKTTRVAAYARVSSGKDAMLHSLSAQVSHYSDMIQQHPGWQYCGVYADEALTGTKDNRENFQRLLQECYAGKVDMIITKSISRFARNTVTLLQTVRELKRFGVDVYFEEQNIHTMSADGELMMTILASYAQEESLSASENQKWRIRKGFANGEMMGLRFMFGYHIKKGKVTVNSEQAVIVKEIFRRVADGEAMNAIAVDLNRRHISGCRGGEWSCGRIMDLVRNEKYLGNALLQKSFINNHLEKKQVKNRGELPQYFAEGTHEAIIDSDTFMRVQERLKQAQQNAGQKSPPTFTVFSGKIQCGKCGKNYKRRGKPNHKGWNCSTFIQKGAKHCRTSVIPEDILCEVSAEVLGIPTFDEQTFTEKVVGITAEDNHILVFHLVNGTEVRKEWEYRSRAESWTPEMKEAARQRTLQQPLPERGWHGYYKKRRKEE